MTNLTEKKTQTSSPENAQSGFWFGWQHLLYVGLAWSVAALLPLAVNILDRGFSCWVCGEVLLHFLFFFTFPVFVVFLTEVLSDRHRSFLKRLLRASFWSVAAFIVASVGGTTFVLPDAAKVYFYFNQSYVQSHWRTDPKNKLIYFPLAMTSVPNHGDEVVPRNFLLFDNDSALVLHTDSYHRSGISSVISPSCPDADYSAQYIAEKIYLLEFSSEALGGQPCLIAPTKAKDIP